MVQLIVLGTGTALTFHHHCTFFVLDDGQDYFLVDGGGGNESVLCLTAMNVDISKLHYGFLSHAHTDHLFGMIYILRLIAYLIDQGRYEGDFTLYCNDVTACRFNQVCQLLLRPGEKNLIGHRFHVVVVADGEELILLQYHLRFFDIHSTKEKQYGFQLQYGMGNTLVFLGDEPLHPSCEPYIRHVDWMLSEAFCLYAERERYRPELYHHATVRQAAENAPRGHVKNLVLWHTEDETTCGKKKRLYTMEAKQYYQGNIFVPEDGDILTL